MSINNNEKNIQGTKERILLTAINLFSEKGVSAVSVRDITKAVGIKESALYNHYKSKDELLDSILEKFMEEYGKTNFSIDNIESQLDNLDPEIFLQHSLLSSRDRITPTIQMMWKVVYMEQFRDKRARDFVINEIINRPLGFYERAFDIMIQKGLIKSYDPKLLASEYHYTLLAMSLERMLLTADDRETDQIVKKMFSHIKFFCENIRLQ